MTLHSAPVSAMVVADLLPELAQQRAGVAVTGLQLDSRQVQSGDAFLALPGERHDGRDHIRAAVAAGAAVIIAERGLNELQRAACQGVPLFELNNLAAHIGAMGARFFGQPSAAMHVVGITGTNGKTTTSRLLSQLLRQQFGHCGVIGTLGAVLDNSVGEALNTTPDALSMQRQLAHWRQLDVAHAVLEVSSHALVQGRANGLNFATAVFTNLTHDHLDYHGDMASYGLAKAQLFQVSGLKTAILNLDDPFAETLRAALRPTVEVIGYSLSHSKAAVRAHSICYRPGGLEAEISTPWGSGRVRSPLAGDFNLSNLLAAISAACTAGVPLARALEWVPALQGVAGRMQYVSNPLELQLVVDYAHTPDALQQALRALRAHTSGNLICVFGCGGDRDAGKRPLMGRVASEHADRVIVTSDNPRSEDPLAIIEEIAGGITGPLQIEPDRARAIALAVSSAGAGDCVLIAGKGHESYQQVGTTRLPFSDVEQLRLAVSGGEGR